MGMGETARTEIADRELASTRERPASRDEHLGILKRNRTGALGPGPIRGHSPQMGQGAATDGAPTRHPPWGDEMMGHLLLVEVSSTRALELRFHDKADELHSSA